MRRTRSSKDGLTRGAGAALLVFSCLSAPTILTPEFPCASVNAQAPAKVRNIAVDFSPEDGCPVGPSAMRCELDCDPFDAPMDARVYLDYRNNSDRQVAAVKFRLRFVDANNKDWGTFHVVDPAAVPPQGGHGVKAKRELTLHPAITALKVRVLQVKYADGSEWSSFKMKELARPGSTANAPGSSEETVTGDTAPPPAPYSPPAQSYAPPAQNYAQAPAQSQPPVASPNGVQGKNFEVAPAGTPAAYVPAYTPPASPYGSNQPFNPAANSAPAQAAPVATGNNVFATSPMQPSTGSRPASPAAQSPNAFAPGAPGAFYNNQAQNQMPAQAPVQSVPPAQTPAAYSAPPAAAVPASPPAAYSAPPAATTSATGAPPAAGTSPATTAAPAVDYSKYKNKGPEPVNAPWSPDSDAPAKP